MHLSALKFSTLTRGGGGWRPFLHLHVKWSFDDVLIFRCVPLSKNDQIFFGIFELFFPKTYTLKGSVSELSRVTIAESLRGWSRTRAKFAAQFFNLLSQTFWNFGAQRAIGTHTLCLHALLTADAVERVVFAFNAQILRSASKIALIFSSHFLFRLRHKIA